MVGRGRVRAEDDLLTVVNKRLGLFGEVSWDLIPALFSSYGLGYSISPVSLSCSFKMGVTWGGCEDAVRQWVPGTW